MVDVKGTSTIEIVHHKLLLHRVRVRNRVGDRLETKLVRELPPQLNIPESRKKWTLFVQSKSDEGNGIGGMGGRTGWLDQMPSSISIWQHIHITCVTCTVHQQYMCSCTPSSWFAGDTVLLNGGLGDWSLDTWCRFLEPFQRMLLWSESLATNYKQITGSDQQLQNKWWLESDSTIELWSWLWQYQTWPWKVVVFVESVFQKSCLDSQPRVLTWPTCPLKASKPSFCV